jgi:SAM-dependent methyltransferase
VPQSVPLWEQPALRVAAGDTLRPGGFRLTDRAAAHIGLRPGHRVLDVGCGLGATVNRLRSRYGARAYGVEPSPNQLTRAAPGARLIQADAQRLPFGDAAFDAVFCECALSLLPAPERGLEEAHRVLLPHGFLIISDLHARDDARPEAGSCAQRAIPLAATRAMVQACGFDVVLLEDHSILLKELAARLILADDGGSCACGCREGRQLGYYLMIAQKRTQPC